MGEDREMFYDDEIAPALADLSKRCIDHGLSLFAAVAYDDEGSVGRTVGLMPDAPLMLRYLDTLAQCWGVGGSVNIDAFFFAVMKHARENGHSSVIFHQLGVPTRLIDPSRTSEGGGAT